LQPWSRAAGRAWTPPRIRQGGLSSNGRRRRRGGHSLRMVLALRATSSASVPDAGRANLLLQERHWLRPRFPKNILSQQGGSRNPAKRFRGSYPCSRGAREIGPAASAYRAGGSARLRWCTTALCRQSDVDRQACRGSSRRRSATRAAWRPRLPSTVCRSVWVRSSSYYTVSTENRGSCIQRNPSPGRMTPSCSGPPQLGTPIWKKS
jgi:hypothetical protein